MGQQRVESPVADVAVLSCPQGRACVVELREGVVVLVEEHAAADLHGRRAVLLAFVVVGWGGVIGERVLGGVAGCWPGRLPDVGCRNLAKAETLPEAASA